MGNRPYGESFWIYTDGCCLGNGNQNAVGGWGVYWKGQTLGRMAGQLQNTTSNRAELTAILEALHMIADSYLVMNSFWLYTDSQYAINCIDEWAPRWEENDWMTSEGQPVKNADLIKRIYEFKEQLDEAGFWVTLCKAEGHSGDPDNDEADRLAKAAARGEDWMRIGYEDM